MSFFQSHDDQQATETWPDTRLWMLTDAFCGGCSKGSPAGPPGARDLEQSRHQTASATQDRGMSRSGLCFGRELPSQSNSSPQGRSGQRQCCVSLETILWGTAQEEAEKSLDPKEQDTKQRGSHREPQDTQPLEIMRGQGNVSEALLIPTRLRGSKTN